MPHRGMHSGPKLAVSRNPEEPIQNKLPLLLLQLLSGPKEYSDKANVVIVVVFTFPTYSVAKDPNNMKS